MENKVYKYPEIGQYRNAIHAVTNTTRYFGKDVNGDPIYNEDPLPTIRYKFTPKGHGTNAGLIWAWDETINDYVRYDQSRERVISPMSDNAGFSTFIHTLSLDEKTSVERFKKILLEGTNNQEMYRTTMVDDKLVYVDYPTIQIYGEWSGKGIQKKVGIASVDKFLMIFGAKVNGRWVSDELLIKIKDIDNRIINVLDLPSLELDIDFENPKDYTEQFDKWIEDIENECPIALYFGLEGTIGEGWVAKPIDPKWHHGRFFFKIKGDKHKGSSKNKGEKTKIEVDPIRVANMKLLIDSIVDEGRLEQGISKLKENNDPIDIKSMGKYLKWLTSDTVKEELDTIISNGFTVKEVNKHISTKGRIWFMGYLDKELGL